jgi:hypothetical protein
MGGLIDDNNLTFTDAMDEVECLQKHQRLEYFGRLQPQH